MGWSRAQLVPETGEINEAEKNPKEHLLSGLSTLQSINVLFCMRKI